MGEIPPRRVVGRILVLLAAAVMELAAVGCSGSAPDQAPGVAIVDAVIDGDTIDVRIAGGVERVRLLGIDTPEIAHPDSPGECFGDEARRLTETLLPPGSTVRLERDIVGRDDYGRILAYVQVPGARPGAGDDVFVNAHLVAEGYATPLFIGPNIARRPAIVDAARRAQRARLGLWSACAN
jgi:micrococcal nuclease